MHLNFGNFSKTRVEAFSDGVFAIVVTLLVLELKLPPLHEVTNLEFLYSLKEIVPKIISWVNSFLVVCVVWMNHHRLMGMFSQIDAGIFWLNNILLMFISFIPFPTAILGEYTNLEYAVSFYGFCLSCTGLGFIIIRLYVQRHPDLLNSNIDNKVFKDGTKASFWYGFMLYFSGMLVSFINPWVAFGIYFFIPIYFIFPRGTMGR